MFQVEFISENRETLSVLFVPERTFSHKYGNSPECITGLTKWSTYHNILLHLILMYRNMLYNMLNNKKINRVNFKDQIGFIEPFMNWDHPI